MIRPHIIRVVSRTLSALFTAATLASADQDPHHISDPLLAEATMLTAGVPVETAAAAAPANPATSGSWGPVIYWTPHIPVTAATLPDGRLLTFSASQRTTFPFGEPEFTYASVWDPATGVFTEINNARHDMFCGGTAMLPDGRVVISGGTNTTELSSTFDYRTNQWNALQNMNDPRWYNTSATLPDGTVFTISGDGGEDTAELWNSVTGWRRLTGIDWSAVTNQQGYLNHWHPFVVLAPNGKLFHFGPTDAMNWVTTTGSGSRQASGQTIPGPQYPKEGAWAMYGEGRILVTGGGQNTTPNPLDFGTGISTNAAYTVNLNGATPVVAPAAPMQLSRQFANTVVLPNGEVLVIGGNTSGLKFTDTGAIFTPEIWSPNTGTWRTLADMAIPRTYHSVALLLPDGRVWSGGGGLSGNAADHQDAQIFTPPALFAANGTPAPRPVITSGPDQIGPGTQFTINASPGLTKFSFIRMSAQTHSVNTDLRYLSLPFTEISAGIYTLTGHANSNVMLPGYWMLFGLNAAGVHSVAKVIQVALNPDVTVRNPGNQQSVTGDLLELPVPVSALPGVSIQYSATGLPDGLTIHPTTGLISGTITADAGDYWTTVNLIPSTGVPLKVEFNWNVLPPDLDNGNLLYEWWLDIDGPLLSQLTENPTYPANPAGRDFLTTFEAPISWGDDHGQRIRGYLHPAVTGTYLFWIAGDDESRLLLSTDANPSNAVEIASVPEWSFSREWTKSPQQASAPVMLEAGKRYYIEALMKEAGGDDSLAVGWQPPGAQGIEVISGQFLSRFNPALAPVAAWQLDERTWNGASDEVKELVGAVTGIHGTSVGGAVTSSDNPVWEGNPGTGRAGSFDGSGQRVSIPFNPALNPGDFTVSAWVRPLSATSDTGRTVVSSRQLSGGQTRGFGLYASTDGMWKFSTGSPWTELTGPGVIANEWTHLTVTFRTMDVTGGVHVGTRSLFVNGALVAEDYGSYVPVTGSPLLIGASESGANTGDFMNGAIDEVRIHAVPLNPDDVVATMALRHRLNFRPVVTSPGTLANLKNSFVSQVILANDIDAGPLTFSATGLPGGLTISPGSGIISGTPNTAGEFSVTVTATDSGGESGSASFTWSIGENLGVLATGAPASPAGTTVTLNATATGGQNPRYKWNFGDGSPDTDFSPSTSTTHNFPGPGRYLVTITATDDTGGLVSSSFYQAIHAPLTASKPTASSAICHEIRATGNDRVWAVNPDNDSVTVIDAVTRTRLAEIPTGMSPRSVALAPDGRVWVTNTTGATLSIISPDTFAVVQTVPLPRGSRPFGLAFSPLGTAAFVALEDAEKLLKLDPVSGALLATTEVGPNVRHLSISGDGSRVYLSRFVTPRLPGEETASVTTSGHGGEVIVVDPATATIERTILLHHGEQADSAASARGIPNYLGAPAISPDGLSAWIPSKQDNIKRGKLRDNQDLNHDMSIRSIASRIDLVLQSEDAPKRIDFDNAGIPSAIAYDPWGIYAFVALEASRIVAVVDVWNHREILRFDAGRAPQGLAVSPDGNTLFVQNFMDRSVSVHDVSALSGGLASPPPAPVVVPTIITDNLPPQTLLGKQLFYDAKDDRLALQEYISCASCHNDAGHDGRVWDFTGFGEGLRNTITLRGHGGDRTSPLHWSGNFDEVQDFEHQIRDFAGGTGLISGNPPHPPLGDSNTGRSPDLDALAAYLASLDKPGDSPHREADGSLTAAARAGERVFRTMDCASCHGGPGFTLGSAGNFPNIGTLKPSSGKRLGAGLTGINIPSLRGLWSTAPYLHDGSAATLEQAVTAHQGVSIESTDLTHLVAYLKSIDDMPATAPVNSSPVAVNDTASTDEDIPLTLGIPEIVTPNDTDADGDTLVISAVFNPINGTVVLNPGGSVTFTPTASHRGPASFDYTISDGTGGTATATVAITVNPVPNIRDWLNTHGLTAAPDEDSDGDSVSNAVEYVIGGNPSNEPDTDRLPTAEMTSLDNAGSPVEYLCFTYRRSDLAHTDSKTTIAAEWSTDLSGTWVTADGTHDEIIRIEDSPGENFDWVKVFVPRSRSSTGVLMMRLRVTMTLPP